GRVRYLPDLNRTDIIRPCYNQALRSVTPGLLQDTLELMLAPGHDETDVHVGVFFTNYYLWKAWSRNPKRPLGLTMVVLPLYGEASEYHARTAADRIVREPDFGVISMRGTWGLIQRAPLYKITGTPKRTWGEPRDYALFFAHSPFADPKLFKQFGSLLPRMDIVPADLRFRQEPMDFQI
ncbi:MAG: hypothetical protein AABY13_03090, partial [Nanoarchaeota archaeon]